MQNRKPFYKIQYYIPKNLSWLDVQTRFDTLDQAVANADNDRVFRIMEIIGKKRSIISHGVPTS